MAKFPETFIPVIGIQTYKPISPSIYTSNRSQGNFVGVSKTGSELLIWMRDADSKSDKSNNKKDNLRMCHLCNASVLQILQQAKCSVGVSPDSDSMGESESESGLESGLGLYPCGLGLELKLHLCGLGLKRCGLGLWSYGLELGLGLHPGGLGLTVSPGESGEKCTWQI